MTKRAAEPIEMPEGYMLGDSRRPRKAAEELRDELGVPVIRVRRGSKTRQPVYAIPSWLFSVLDVYLFVSAATVRDPEAWEPAERARRKAIETFARSSAEWCEAALTVYLLGGREAFDDYVEARNEQERAALPPDPPA